MNLKPLRLLMVSALLTTSGVIYSQTTAKEGMEPIALVKTDSFHPGTLDNQQSMSEEQRAAILKQIYTIYAKPYGMTQQHPQFNNGARSTRIDILGASPIAYCVLYEKGNAKVATVVDKQGVCTIWQGGEPGFIVRIDSSGKVIETLAVKH